MTQLRFLQTGKIALHYKHEGIANNEAVPLVFVNSLGCDLRIWDGVIPHFVDKFAIIRYDKRGHGLSDCPPAPYTIHDHANDLLGLLDHLDIPGAILIGISVGGVIALDFAAAHPERVRALILCDTAAKIGTAEMWNERINTLRQHGMSHLGDAILARWFSPTFREQQPSAYRGYYNMLTRMPVEGYTGTCEALRDADLTPLLPTIQAQTLVLCGTQDAATSPSQGQALAEALPNARFEVIENAAHLPCIEQPDQMANIMLRFLEETAHAGR